MKYIVAMALAVASISSYAQDSACRMQGEIFVIAAQSRDQGMPPETAYGISSGYLKAGVPEINKEFLKKVINTVYFEPAFAGAGGPQLGRQVVEYCLTGGKPRYQPLK